MMVKRFLRLSGSILAAGGLLVLAGCGTNLLPTSLVSNESAADPLNSIVSGDVAEAFRSFVGDLQVEQGLPAASPLLSDEERATIEALQTQLDSGEITAEAFAAGVDAALGDRAPRAAFGGLGFFGHPFGHGPRRHVGQKLGLSDEQRAAAEQIFRDTHQQIRLLRLTALANIRLQLTDEQRAKLDELRAERFASIRDGEPLAPGALRERFRGGRPFGGPHGAGGPFAGGPHGAGGPFGGDGEIRERVRGFFARLATALNITDEQRTAIQAIRTQLRTDVQAAHQAARDQFKALLTAEQLEILAEIEARIEERFGDKLADDEAGEDESKAAGE